MVLTYNKIGLTCIKSSEQMPKEKHYAILIFSMQAIRVPGDERSRTAPGHGYPEHTDYYETFEYWVTNSLDILKKGIALLEQEKDTPKYNVIQVSPLSISTEIKINVGVE